MAKKPGRRTTNTSKTTRLRQLDIDLWIILLVTLVVFVGFAVNAPAVNAFIIDSQVPVLVRTVAIAAVQFGVAGLGISIVCALRRQRFSQFGLRKENTLKAIIGTVLCFVPLVGVYAASGQMKRFLPFSAIAVTDEVLAAGIGTLIPGMLIIIVVWGFFEGFNYAVISTKINQRYPVKNKWINYGAIVCAIFCLLLHPIQFTAWGIAEILAAFFAIYTMLIIRHETDNSWGCVFVFLFIWNAMS